MVESQTLVSTDPVIPKGPVLGWSSLLQTTSVKAPSFADLPHRALTSSGRAALYQAFRQLELAADEPVLVPSYHCPTMVAPIVLAGLRPVFYDIRDDGLPDLASLDADARAIIVPQYFGLPQSLHEVRAWCDRHGVVLIEDCAHCYFGEAGSRPVGAWGDYCTASLTKFFPVPEGGLLASAHYPLRPLQLGGQGMRAQVKGFVDILETASQFRRLPGLNNLLGALIHLKRHRPGRSLAGDNTAPDTEAPDAMLISDMGRVDRLPLWVSAKLWTCLPEGRIIARRRANFDLYANMLAGQPGQQRLAALPHDPVAPYVYPFWVNGDADRIYHSLRTSGVPVFRWDRLWPNTPHGRHETSRQWSRHLLQFLCHQDLREADIRYAVRSLQGLLADSSTTAKQ